MDTSDGGLLMRDDMAKTTNKGTGADTTAKAAKKKVAKKTVAKKATAAKPTAKKTTAKKTAAKKTTASKKTVAKKKATKRAAAGRAAAGQITLAERHRLIAEAAFLRSESQGFTGDPCADWLAAEAEIDARLSRAGIKASG